MKAPDFRKKEGNTMNFQYLTLEMAHAKTEEMLREKKQTLKSTSHSFKKPSFKVNQNFMTPVDHK
jgi:hypothetical protein